MSFSIGEQVLSINTACPVPGHGQCRRNIDQSHPRIEPSPPFLYIKATMKQISILGTETLPPIGKIICIGQNYAKHAKEMNFDVPKTPVFFLKPSSAVIFNHEQIVLPTISNDVQHEVELTVLIGTGGKNISRETALQHVAGYGAGLDMTMRDVQLEAKKKGLPWTLAKGFDTSAPLSEFVPARRIGDPAALELELTIDGTVRQSGSTADMVFPVASLIAYISQYVTLDAGDIIFTGMPEGVSQVQHGNRLEAKLKSAGGALLTSVSVDVA
jgi:5-carboxymethyl-2-hydroxymuconate isomerase